MRQEDMFDSNVIVKNSEDQEIMKPQEVADYLRCGINYVYGMLNRGELAGFKLGNAWVISKEAVNIYIRQRSGLI